MDQHATTTAQPEPLIGSGSPSVVTLRPFASPLPIGLIGLTVGSTVLACSQLSWFPAGQGHEVALCLLGFVVPLQFISFVFALLGRDEGAASAMAILGGSWLAIGLVMVTTTPGTPSGALGVLLLTGGVTLFLPALAAGFSKPLVTAVLAVAGARFVLTGVYQTTAIHRLEVASGVVGLVVTVIAGYAAAAFALEAATDRRIIPTARLASSPRPGDAETPAAPVDTEAGVRSLL